MNIKSIIEGHYNEYLNKQNEISEERLNICKQCPLYKKTALGAICNSTLYLNVETNETSSQPIFEFKNGCGCRLNAKTRIPESKCPVGKW